METSTVAVGDVNPGSCGTLPHEARIKLIKRRQFRVRKKRLFVISPQVKMMFLIHYTLVRIKKDAEHYIIGMSNPRRPSLVLNSIMPPS